MSITRSFTLAACAVLAAGAAAQASADTITTTVVTPADMNRSTFNSWNLANYRTAGDGNASHTSTTVAAINGTQARSGNGSVQMSQTDGSAKADFTYYWGFDGRTLGALTSFSFDWYRASGTGANGAPAYFAPAVRIAFDADGNAGTTNDQGYLIWERVYNDSSAILLDQWNSSNLMADYFWQRRLAPGVTIENYTTTLADWENGAQPSGAAKLSANSAILGIEFGIGSGWGSATPGASNFTGFVDNVNIGFNGNARLFNFEATAAAADVPEPASLALLGLGLAGLALRRRAAK